LPTDEGRLTDEQRTGGRDSQLSRHAEEGGALVGMESTRQTDKVLARIKRRRIATDVEEGFFRDWPDWKAPMLEVTLGPRCWLDLLTRAVGAAGKVAIDSGSEEELRAKLEAAAEVAVAWIEALDRRRDERQVAAVRLGWWARLRFRLTGRLP
jgi:hypothetical protein